MKYSDCKLMEVKTLLMLLFCIMFKFQSVMAFVKQLELYEKNEPLEFIVDWKKGYQNINDVRIKMQFRNLW